MLSTTKIPRDQLEAYFDKFTKHFLRNESTNAVDVEVLTPELGDQYEAEGAHLVGVTYDPKSNAVELALESGDHRVYRPVEVWTLEDSDGFVKAIEIVHKDGAREVVRVRRLGVRPRE
jgi:radical SAM superfamily enzyme with C-terminal helix-hairpin-helix motif